jgi:hypothetical protein
VFGQENEHPQTGAAQVGNIGQIKNDVLRPAIEQADKVVFNLLRCQGIDTPCDGDNHKPVFLFGANLHLFLVRQPALTGIILVENP